MSPSRSYKTTSLLSGRTSRPVSSISVNRPRHVPVPPCLPQCLWLSLTATPIPHSSAYRLPVTTASKAFAKAAGSFDKALKKINNVLEPFGDIMGKIDDGEPRPASACHQGMASSKGGRGMWCSVQNTGQHGTAAQNTCLALAACHGSCPVTVTLPPAPHPIPHLPPSLCAALGHKECIQIPLAKDP